MHSDGGVVKFYHVRSSIGLSIHCPSVLYSSFLPVHGVGRVSLFNIFVKKVSPGAHILFFTRTSGLGVVEQLLFFNLFNLPGLKM